LLVAAGVVTYVFWEREEPQGKTCCSLPEYRETVIEPVPTALTEQDLARAEFLSALAVLPGQAYPAVLPWAPLQKLGERGSASLETMLRQQPLAFLERCLERTEQEIQGYSLTFLKRERVQGKLYPAAGMGYEVVTVHFRARPFSVLMDWKQNAHLAQKVLYVEGENNGKMLVRPAGRFLSVLVVTRDVDGPDAKESGRYMVNEFGLYEAMKRSVDAMHAAQKRDALHLTYQGLVILHEVGDRPCYKFLRTPYEPAEEDGVNELVLYVDRETWLQVGSVLHDAQGELIGEYFFRDIQINPTFPANQFQRSGL
jgi:hypothetical protein